MSSPNVDELFTYIQERCLWQFFSRAWDRTENIAGILGGVTNLLVGKTIPRGTPMERVFYADAKAMVDDLHGRFPALSSLSGAQIESLMNEVQLKITDLAVTHSRNSELNQKLY